MAQGWLEGDDPSRCPICGLEAGDCSPELSRDRVVLTTLYDQERRAEGMATITVQDRVYLDADGKATTDPEKGVTLWSTPGTEVLEEDAAAVGYKAKAVAKPKGTKVVEGPGGDK